MSLLENHSIQCPYCAQWIDIAIDSSVQKQEYVEDCTICCQPIIINVSLDEQNTSVNVSRENE